MSKLISERGYSICRVCNHRDLKSILDLGSQPLPAEYGKKSDEILETFPLHLRICPKCGLGQLGEYVTPERIFHDAYPYLSSVSSIWTAHAKKFANEMKNILSLTSKSLVLELASNDGYLLSEFKKLDVPVLGIEPAANVASIAMKNGVHTISEFFGAKTAKDILKRYGYPKLIVANNVFAHIPDMQDFTEGLAILSNDATVITIENPSFALLLEKSLFDTIYHEHYSYLTAHSVKKIANTYGLNLVNVESLKTHGGSNRYWLSSSLPVRDSVLKILEEENSIGLFDSQKWSTFAKNSKSIIKNTSEWLQERNKLGDIVVAYGAAHKGNTFLNSIGEQSRVLKYVVDGSLEKQGKFLPGSRLPVLAPNQLASCNPSDVLILPWNIADELANNIRELAPAARIWVAQPKMRQIL